jgi:hypothetical protein
MVTSAYAFELPLAATECQRGSKSGSERPQETKAVGDTGWWPSTGPGSQI